MAPKRRGGAAAKTAAQSRQQSTLSFNGKKSQVTKPSVSQDAKTTKKEETLLEEAAAQADVKVEESQPEVSEPTTAEKAIEQQTEQEISKLDAAVSDPLQTNGKVIKTEDVLGGRAQTSDQGAVGGKGSGWVGDEEEKARKISETQIKKYWRDKEQERLAPRVHQQDLSVHEKVLREWDMSGQYGPCIGIARLKRWKRANMLGLQPPIEVLAVLLKDIDAGENKSQRAHVDELLSSRFVET